MLKYCNNEYLKTETQMNTDEQFLFFQKMKELLYMHSGISYSFKLHNSYTILQELFHTICDYEEGKINGMIVEDIRKEAKELLLKDKVIRAKHIGLYETIKEEIGKGLVINKSNQAIEPSSLPRVHAIKESIKQLFRTFQPVDYLRKALSLTKEAIDNNNGEDVVKLCNVIVSSSIMVGRTISGMYISLDVLFINKENTFDDNWRRWAASMLNINAQYKCYIPVQESYCHLLEHHQRGNTIKEECSNAKNIEYLEDDKEYFCVDIKTAASDLPAIYSSAYELYRKELSIIEFATAKVEKLENVVIAFDCYNNSFIKIEQKQINGDYVYKPFNQYHVNIDRQVKEFVSKLNKEDNAKVIGAISNVCNFEGESNEYRFLLLWSSLEALFRSSQYETAIGAIKNIIPNILVSRYVYYKLFDFIKDIAKAKVDCSYNGKKFIKENPNERDIESLYKLLQEEAEYENLKNLCKQKYVLLFYKCEEIHNMTVNSGAMRNTLMHHKETLEFHLQRMYRVRNKYMHHAEVDTNIEALYKHLLVYVWECIREMAYVFKTREIKTLEELYAYFRMNQKIMQRALSDAGAVADFNNIKNGYLN